jgi:hypothetical protein
LTDSLQEPLSRQLALDGQITRITEWRRGNQACRHISEIPGVGLLSVTVVVVVVVAVVVAVVRNAQPFRLAIADARNRLACVAVNNR